MPFGPLNPLHARLLAAEPYALTPACVAAQALPFALYVLQAYLLLRPGTRALRAAVGVLAIAAAGRAWAGWRFVDPALDGLNVSTWIWFPLVLRLIEWSHRGYVRHLVFDNRFMAAVDLCFNWRMVGVADGKEYEGKRSNGAVNGSNGVNGSSTANGKHVSNGSNGSGGSNGSNSSNGSNGSTGANGHHSNGPHSKGHHANGHSHTKEASFYPRYVPVPPPRPRPLAVARHLAIVAIHAVCLDACIGMLSTLAPLVSASQAAGADPFEYAEQHATVSFGGYSVQPHFGVSVLCLAAGGAGFAALSIIYHALAALGTATLWPARCFPDLFDWPCACESMCDLWGRRWHQIFNHTFTATAFALAALLGLPRRAMRLPIAYVLSTALHALGNITASNPPSPSAIMQFFGLVGAACYAETRFKAFTGRRVGGAAGRLWTWSVMLFGLPWVVGAWLPVIVGGSAGPVGRFVARGVVVAV